MRRVAPTSGLASHWGVEEESARCGELTARNGFRRRDFCARQAAVRDDSAALALKVASERRVTPDETGMCIARQGGGNMSAVCMKVSACQYSTISASLCSRGATLRPQQ